MTYGPDISVFPARNVLFIKSGAFAQEIRWRMENLLRFLAVVLIFRIIKLVG